MINKYYIVNTFKTETASNYDIAINYYRQRTKILMEALQLKLNNQFLNNIKEIPDIEKIFQDTFLNYNKNFSKLWQGIYDKHYDRETLAQKLREWNKNTQQLNENITNAKYTVDFLKFLSDNQNNELELENTKGIDFSTIKNTQEKIMNKEFTTAKSFGGARGRYFGEIFEQGAGLVLQNSLGMLMNSLQLGGERSASASNLGRKTQGKTDYGFFLFDVAIEKDEKLGNVFINKSNNNERIPMEAVEMIDLQSESMENILKKHASGSSALIAGATMKQWTDSMITSVSKTSGASFGRSQYSANYVNQRKPDGISNNFSSRITFEDYTAYAISRFLLNIIGIYNIIMASGSKISFTYSWLESIRNGARLVHTIKDNGDGKYTAYPAIKEVFKS